jgi:hypothetical protein
MSRTCNDIHKCIYLLLYLCYRHMYIYTLIHLYTCIIHRHTYTLIHINVYIYTWRTGLYSIISRIKPGMDVYWSPTGRGTYLIITTTSSHSRRGATRRTIKSYIFLSICIYIYIYIYRQSNEY